MFLLSSICLSKGKVFHNFNYVSFWLYLMSFGDKTRSQGFLAHLKYLRFSKTASSWSGWRWGSGLSSPKRAWKQRGGRALDPLVGDRSPTGPPPWLPSCHWLSKLRTSMARRGSRRGQCPSQVPSLIPLSSWNSDWLREVRWLGSSWRVCSAIHSLIPSCVWACDWLIESSSPLLNSILALFCPDWLIEWKWANQSLRTSRARRGSRRVPVPSRNLPIF